MAFVFSRGFDPQPRLRGGGLALDPLQEADRDGLAAAAADPLIWAGHPATDRYRREVFDPYFDMLAGAGSALAVRDGGGRIIGCSLYYTDTNAPSRLSIGFTFLERAHWGGGTNRVLKRLMLGHLFHSASEAWFHIAPGNLRSQVATTRLGAVFTHEDEIDLGGGRQVWRCYCLTAEGWARSEAVK